MSIAFQILKEGKAQKLNDVDKHFCEAFHIQFHEKLYGGGIYNWFNIIGWCTAASNKKIDTPFTDYDMENELAKFWCAEPYPRYRNLVRLRKSLKVYRWMSKQGYQFVRI